jgi:DNA ligase (NAD+)
LEKLVDWGWVENLTDLYELEFMWKDKWIAQPGFGEKSVEKILYNIKNSQNVPLNNFISALGIPTIGVAQAKDICKHISSWSEFRDLVDEKFDFCEWEGFGPEKTSYLWNFDYEEADLLIAKYIVVTCDKEENEEMDFSLEGEKFCITGSLSIYKNRNALKEAIESRGGKVVTSVTSFTNYLITNTPNSGTIKNKRAKELGIPIITEQEFINYFIEG